MGLVVALGLFLFCGEAYAQSALRQGTPAYTVFEPEFIGTSEGINSLSRDQLGRLLVTSGDMLLAFDGAHWTQYDQVADRNLSAAVIHCTVLGIDKEMYASTSVGLRRIEFLADQRFRLRPVEGVPSDWDASITAFPWSFRNNAYLYFYDTHRAIRYDVSTGTLEADLLRGANAGYIAPWGDDLVTFGTDARSYLYTREGELVDIEDRSAESRRESRAGVAWGGHGFLLGHENAFTLVDYSRRPNPWQCEILEFETHDVTAMLPISDDYIAIAVKARGLYVVDVNGRIVQALDRQIDHRFGDIDQLLDAGNGVVWASMGKSLLRTQFLTPLTEYSAIVPYALVYPILFLHNGTPICITDGKLVEVDWFDGGGIRSWRRRAPQHPSYIFQATSVPDGVLFVDFEGVFLLRDDDTIERILDLPAMTLIFGMNDGSGTVIAAGEQSIVALGKRDGKWRPLASPTPNAETCYYGYRTGPGEAWIEQGPGRVCRVRFEDGMLTAKTYTEADGLQPSWINIWMYEGRPIFGLGSGRNVIVWDEETQRFVEQTDPVLRRIAEQSGVARPGFDSFGNIWIPTNGPHTILRRGAAGDYVEDRATLASIQDETLIIVIPEANGVMWLLGDRKIYRYDPSLRKASPPRPGPTEIYRVELANARSTLFDATKSPSPVELRVPFSQNSLLFRVTSPNIGYVGNISHKYFIEGFTEDWLPITSPNTLALMNLPSRDYELQIRAQFGGENVGEPARFAFVVLTPFWNSWEAYVLYVLVAIALWFASASLLHRRARRRTDALEKLVSERTRALDLANKALRSAYEQVKSADSAKTAFLASVSHEMRTPLNAIIGPSQLLKMEATSQDQIRFLDMIHNAGNRLLEYINEVLQFTSQGANEFRPKETEFSLSAMIDEIDVAYTAKAKEKKLSLEVEYVDEFPEVWRGDRNLIGQVVCNLLDNAIKYTECGGVTLRIERCRETKTGDGLRFVVDDTGIGVADENRDSIFEPFRQVNNVSYYEFSGAGLGLAICKQIVDRLGGEIDFTSSLGSGSSFWFTVPLAEVAGFESMSVAKTAQPSTFDARSRKALVIDDLRTNLEVASAMLAPMNCIIETANDGGQAVDKAMSDRYDLILMDLRMPGLDGLEASARIRNTGPNRKTPIIAVSAYLSEQMKKACESAGINLYVNKPYTREELESAIRACLDR